MNTLLKSLLFTGGLIVALPSVAAELKPVTLSEFVAKVKAEQAEKDTQANLLAQDLTIKPTTDAVLEAAPVMSDTAPEVELELEVAEVVEEAVELEQPVVTAEPEVAEPVQAQTATAEVKQS